MLPSLDRVSWDMSEDFTEGVTVGLLLGLSTVS